MPLQWRNQIWQSLEKGTGERCSECGQYPNLSEGATGQRRQSLEEGAGKRCLECVYGCGLDSLLASCQAAVFF